MNARFDGGDRYQKIRCDSEAIDRLLVEVFVEAHSQELAEVLLDIDATDTPFDGPQEGRFFHGYHGHYCYLSQGEILGSTRALNPLQQRLPRLS